MTSCQITVLLRNISRTGELKSAVKPSILSVLHVFIRHDVTHPVLQARRSFTLLNFMYYGEKPCCVHHVENSDGLKTKTWLPSSSSSVSKGLDDREDIC